MAQIGLGLGWVPSAVGMVMGVPIVALGRRWVWTAVKGIGGLAEDTLEGTNKAGRRRAGLCGGGGGRAGCRGGSGGRAGAPTAAVGVGVVINCGGGGRGGGGRGWAGEG